MFVDVPFPGTRAWTGTIIAYVLGMLFWFGRVILAMLVVNFLMNLGLKYAIVIGVLLFFSLFCERGLVAVVQVFETMWNLLRDF
jgi:hypothetical protein